MELWGGFGILNFNYSISSSENSNREDTRNGLNGELGKCFEKPYLH